MDIVAFVGYAGSGKDTACDFALEIHQGQTTKLAFADALRSEVLGAYRALDQSMLFDRQAKELPTTLLSPGNCSDPGFQTLLGHRGYVAGQPMSPREVMQLWGTEYRRSQNPRYWLDQVHHKILMGLREGLDLVVISDCRFVNEAQYIREIGGYLVSINRKSHEPKEGGSAHQSELELRLIRCDMMIDNNGGLANLKSEVRRILQSIAKRKSSGGWGKLFS